MKKKIFVIILAVLPMVLGTIGYSISGERFTTALYGALGLYSGGALSDAYNVYIEIARWTALLVTATAILSVLQSLWDALRCRIRLLGRKDSVSVYSDTKCKISFGKGVHTIYPGDKFKKYARSHIIMFSTDKKNLEFYEAHKAELAGKKTYISVKDVECCFLDSLGDVTVFDINGAIARGLWKDISLWNMDGTEFDIVIWGGNTLAGDIIATGLQLNLFSNNQKVRYHVITDNDIFRIRNSELRLMNDDELHFYGQGDPEIWKLVSKADMIIMPEVPDAETAQTIVVKAGESKVYYYSPQKGDIVSHFSYGNIVPFGRDEDILTDENIRRDGLVRRAISLNEHYAKLYGTEANWNALSGFLKGSNISASDYGEVLRDLKEKISEDEMAELEHIRWCRFMFLNYYTYGIPENGKNRDDVKRIHKDLVGFDELTSAEKRKDVEAVRIIRSL